MRHKYAHTRLTDTPENIRNLRVRPGIDFIFNETVLYCVLIFIVHPPYIYCASRTLSTGTELFKGKKVDV